MHLQKYLLWVVNMWYSLNLSFLVPDSWLHLCFNSRHHISEVFSVFYFKYVYTRKKWKSHWTFVVIKKESISGTCNPLRVYLFFVWIFVGNGTHTCQNIESLIEDLIFPTKEEKNCLKLSKKQMQWLWVSKYYYLSTSVWQAISWNSVLMVHLHPIEGLKVLDI
jgi:hypothetical protein